MSKNKKQNKRYKQGTQKKEDKKFDKKRLAMQICIVGLAFVTAFSFLFVSFLYM